MSTGTKQRWVNLDTMVVAALALDKSDAARDFVSAERARGSKILLSPGVILELAGAAKDRREKYLAVANAYCDGYTNVRHWAVLQLEIEAFNSGKSMPDIPTLPISELAWLANDGDARAAFGDFDRPKKIKELAIKNLDALKREILAEEVAGGFKDFYSQFGTMFYKVMMVLLAKDGIPEPNVGPNGPPSKIDNRAMHAAMGMQAANIFRRCTVSDSKGAAAISDMFNVVEIAYSDAFLTRDNELYECDVLRKSAWPDSTPEILLVP